MAGNYEKPEQAEFNVECDKEASVFFTAHCPVPVVYLGFEAGLPVLTGGHLIGSENTMLRDAYKCIHAECLRPSWDPMTVWFALHGEDDLMRLSYPVTVRFDENARVVMTDGGKDRYVIVKASPEVVAATINAEMK